MVFKLAKNDPDNHIYVHDSFLVNVHWDDMRLPHFLDIGEVCDQLLKEHGSITSLILLRGAINVDLSSAAARKAGSELTAKYSPYSTGQAIVIEAGGFIASLARSVLTGINLIARAKTPQRVFQDPREGVEWLLGLPGQPAAIRGAVPKLWPHIQEIMGRHARADARQARIAG